MEIDEEDLGYFGSPKLFAALMEDVDISFSELEKNRESQYLRRNTVRAVFCFIEGICSVFLNEVRLKHIRVDLGLSGKEKKVVENKETELLQRIKKSFSSYAKLHSVIFAIDTSSHEFEHLMYAKNIRNRLAHPKRYVHILITDDDMSSIAKTYIWIKSEFKRVISAMIEENIRQMPESIREEFRVALYEET